MEVLRHVFILILTQLPSPVRSRNPVFFPCDDVNATAVDCSSRPLVHIPVIRSSAVLSLDLSHTKIEKVGPYAFSGMQNLQTLKIMENCLPGIMRALDDSSCNVQIHPDALRGLHQLHSLYLSGNSLTTLPWLPKSLTLLDLGSNRFFNITHPFNAPNLEQLLLDKNCFYANPCNQSFHIAEGVLTELSKLRNLTLGYNNVTSVPTGLPRSLESLDLRENAMTEIFEGAFAGIPRLRYLNLEWNCQRCDHAARPCFPCPNNDSLRLHPNSLYAENSSIRTLSLRGNSLRDFPVGLFLPLTRLEILDLSDNLLAYTIGNGTFFSELKHLTWISLIYNYKPLCTFPRLTLSPHLGSVANLTTLLLSGNFFRSVSGDSLEVLSGLHKLKTLEMRMNFISYCNMSALRRFPSLTRVDLSQNMLNFLPRPLNNSAGLASPAGSRGGGPFAFSEPSVPPPAVVDEADAEALLWEIPDTNMLEDIPTMWQLKNYYCQRNLTFDISQNNILFLDKVIFVGMEEAICLDLSYNYMSQTLTGGIFEYLKNLVYLDMSFNRIDLYYQEAFAELNATLKVLDLSNNEFHFLMRGMGHRFEFLSNLRQLEFLSMANNGIGMRINQRLKSSSLKYLYFSGNRLDIMWGSYGNNYAHFFQDLTNLTYLDISQNQLASLSPDVLCNLPRQIEAVIISNNDIDYFPWENITVLSNLRHLNLSGNLIASLPDVLIGFGPNFALLDLSVNKISSLPENFFRQARALSHLYLSDNSLKELDLQFLPAPLKFGSALHKLTLHGNPFKCDCENTGFADFLRTSLVDIPYLTTSFNCEYPESQQGQNVLTIERRSCQDIYGNIAFLFSSFVVVAFTLLPLLRHLFGWDLWYCLHVLWAGQKGYSLLPGSNSHKHYDACVVFDTENEAVRDWVYNELGVQLEKSGYRRFSLCLEERDWIPGLSRIENLHNAVYGSVKTVFVLSSCGSNFVDGVTMNGTVRQAFFMVQQRLLDDKVDVAVLVLLDKTFPKLKYLQLRKRLCEKSVMSWPVNPRAQPLFWNRMRMVLSSDNLQFYDNNVSAGFM